MIRKVKEAYKIWKLLKVNKMTCVFSEEGVQNCANHIAYRVQRALYEIFRQSDDSLEWDQFVLMLRSVRAMREAAQTVAVTAVKNIRFDFELTEYVELDDGLLDEEIQAASLFEGDVAEGLVIVLMLRAEIAHHRARSREGNEGYTLKQYMRDLKKDEALQEVLIRAMRKAIRDMDFHEIWMHGGIWRMAELSGKVPKKLNIETLTIEKAMEDI